MVSYKTCEATQLEIMTILAVEDILSTPKQQLNYLPKVNEWKRMSIALTDIRKGKHIYSNETPKPRWEQHVRGQFKDCK